MKIYTSYYAKVGALRAKGIVPIGISLYSPKFFHGPTIPSLAPRRYMLDDSLSEEQYTRLYVEDVLKRVDISLLLKVIQQHAGDRPVALLCYEKPGDFCHRHIAAKWIQEKCKIEITEYPFDEEKKKVDNSTQQISLF